MDIRIVCEQVKGPCCMSSIALGSCTEPGPHPFGQANWSASPGILLVSIARDGRCTATMNLVFSPHHFLLTLCEFHIMHPDPPHFPVLPYPPSTLVVFFSNMDSEIKLRFSCFLACTLLTMSSSHPKYGF